MSDTLNVVKGVRDLEIKLRSDLSSACMMGLEDVASIKEATH